MAYPNSPPGSHQTGPVVSEYGFRLGTKASSTELVDEDGNVTIPGAMAVTGALTATGLANLNGGIAVDTNKFTVSAAGAMVAASTVKSTGDFTVGDSVFVVTAASGNTAIKGTLTVGVDGTGHDVKLFGDTSGRYAEWDADSDTLNVQGFLNSQVTATAAVDGTMRGAYVVATNFTEAGTGAIRGIEVKARAADSSNNGANIATLEGASLNADAKDKDVTTMRGVEVILDGAAGGTVTLAQGILISNNASNTQTTSYALDINSGTAAGHKAFTADIRLQNGETISNATDGVVAVSGILEAATIRSADDGHLVLQTQDSNKNVRINSQTFTVDASIVGVQIKPAGGVALTNGIVGLEVEPRINDTFSGTSIHAIYAAPWKRGTGAAGDLSGDFLAIEGKLQSDSGYTGTIAGPAAILRAVNSLHGTITTGPVVIYANNHEGNVAWTALLEGAEALGTHSLTTAEDKTGQAKAGTLKVRFNNTLYHIQLYADSGA